MFLVTTSSLGCKNRSEIRGQSLEHVEPTLPVVQYTHEMIEYIARFSGKLSLGCLEAVLRQPLRPYKHDTGNDVSADV